MPAQILPGLVLVKDPDVVVAEGRGIPRIVPVVPEGAGGTVQQVQSALAGACPEPSGPVSQDRPDDVVAEAGGVARVVGEVGEPVGGGIEALQAAVEAAHPEDAVAVLADALDLVVGEAEGVPGVVLEDRESIPVEAVQAVLRDEPHESLLVLQDRVHDALGQALFDGDVGEGEIPLLGRQEEAPRHEEDQGRNKAAAIFPQFSSQQWIRADMPAGAFRRRSAHVVSEVHP